MPTPKVSDLMSAEDQKKKIYGRVYREFDFSKPMGVMALAKELIEVQKFERLFPRTKVLFVQRDEEKIP